MAEPEVKKPNYFLIKHLGTDRPTRGLRAANRGNRARPIVFDDGIRVLNGRRRVTELPFSDYLDNHEAILDWVRAGVIEVQDAQQHAISYEQLKALTAELGKGREGFHVSVGVTPDQEKQEATIYAEANKDSTKPDMDLSAVLAAQDQAEAKKRGEANEEPKADEKPSYSEDDLLAMNRKELNKVAAEEFGVESPEKLPSKQAVVEAIFKASEE
jgi:predicted amidohydrolase YtcJ